MELFGVSVGALTFGLAVMALGPLVYLARRRYAVAPT